MSKLTAEEWFAMYKLACGGKMTFQNSPACNYEDPNLDKMLHDIWVDLLEAEPGKYRRWEPWLRGAEAAHYGLFTEGNTDIRAIGFDSASKQSSEMKRFVDLCLEARERSND